MSPKTGLFCHRKIKVLLGDRPIHVKHGRYVTQDRMRLRKGGINLQCALDFGTRSRHAIMRRVPAEIRQAKPVSPGQFQ
jgi:hypothetical protein